jgi:hypothetical protein
MLTPRAGAASMACTSWRSVDRRRPASDVSFSPCRHHRFPAPSACSADRSEERSGSAAALHTSGDVLRDSPSGLETRPTSTGLGSRGSRLETSDVVPEPECIGCARESARATLASSRRSRASFAAASACGATPMARLRSAVARPRSRARPKSDPQLRPRDTLGRRLQPTRFRLSRRAPTSRAATGAVHADGASGSRRLPR